MDHTPTKILLIEDNPGDARLVKEALADAGAASFELTWVKNLANGLAHLKRDPIDAVLLDLTLPDSTGFVTFEKLHASVPETAIILLTGLQDDNQASRAVHEGAQDYLVKGQVNGSLLARSIRYAIERKEIDAKLLRSEENHRALIEQASDGIFVSDDQGNFVDVNSRGCTMLGYSREELLGRKFQDIVSAEDQEKAPLHLNELRAGKSVLSERQVIRKDGSRFMVEINAKGLPDGRLQGIVRDITERKLVEEALRASEKKYRALHESMIDGFVTTALDGKFLESNEIYRNMLGYSEAELAQLSYREITPEKWAALENDIVENQILRRGYSDVYEKEYRRKDGTVFPVELHTALMRDEQGKPTYMWAIARDITERKRMERAILLMSEVQRQIAHQETIPDIYRLVGEKVQELLGDSYVAVTMLDEQIQATKVVGLYGFGDIYQNLVRAFKGDPARFAYRIDEMADEELRQLKSGSLAKIEGGLYRLLLGKVSRKICETMERQLKLTGIYTMGFVWQDIYLGNVVILARHDISPYQEIIETIMNQASVAIKRIRSDDALRQSEERYRTVANFTYDWEYWVGPDGRWLYCSPSCERITGYPPEKFMETPGFLAEIALPEDRQKLIQHAKKPGEKGMDSFDFRIVCKDGTMCWLTHVCREIVTPDGKKLGRRASNRDITARKRGEEALRQSEERYRSIFENTGLGIFESTPEGHVTRVNPAYARMFGFDSPEAVEEDMPDVANAIYVHPEMRAQFVEQVLEHPGMATFENEYRRKDGATFIGSLRLQAITAGSDRPQYLFGFVEDITARKRTEERLHRQNRELFAINRIGQAFSQLMQPAEIMELLYTNVGQVLENRNLYIALYDEASQRITFPIYTINGELRDLDTRPLRNGLTEYVLRSKAPVLISSDQPAFLKEHGIDLMGTPSKSYLGVPLQIGERVLGVIAIQDYEREDVFDAGQIELLSTLASQAAIALENARLYGAIQQELEERKRAEEALRRSQAILAQAGQIAHLGAWEIEFGQSADLNANPLRWSDEVYRIFGYEPGEVESSNELFFERVHPDDRQRVRAAVAGALAEKQPYQIEHRIVLPDGTERNVIEHAVLTLDQQGQPLRLLGAVQDITERKQAEEAQRRNENRLTTIFEASLAGIILVDPQGIITLANRHMAELFGCPLDELIGSAYVDHVYPEEQPIGDANMRKMITGELDSVSHERRYSRKDGGDFWGYLSGRRLTDESGKLLSLVGIITDITERKNAEDALRISENRLRTFLNSSSDLAFLKDSQLRHIYANQALLDFFGKPVEAVIGKDDFELMSAEDAERSRKTDAAALKQMQVGITEEVVNGQIFETIKFPVELGDGQFGVGGFIRDISERKQAQDALARRTEELDRLYRASGSLLSSTPFDVPTLARTIVDVVQQEFGQANCSVFLVSRDSNDLERLAVAGPYADQVSRTVLNVDGAGLVPQAVRTGQVINTPDVHNVPSYIPSWSAAHAELTLPLKVGDEIIGAIDVQSAQPGAFDANDERLMTVFSERAALSLEHARLFAQTERRMNNLAALRTIDLAISSSFDLKITLGILLEQATKQLNVHAADILVFNHVTQTFQYSSGQGFRTQGLQNANIRLGEGYAGRAARERRTIRVQNLDQALVGLPAAGEFSREGFVSYLGVPLFAKGQIKGVMEIYQREALDLEPEAISFLEMLASQAAIAIDNTELFYNLQSSNTELVLAYDSTLAGWASALELRDKEIEGHTRRAADLTTRLARAVGVSENELVHIHRGALLHDIGKMGIPDNIVLKPGPLTDEEWAIMRKHPEYAFDMLSPISYLQPAIDIPYSHHERWDGSGYPRGMKGEQIPLAARIFAVVDVWDALTSDRPYRPAWSEEKTRAYLRQQAGILFEPKIVEIFLGEVINAERR